MNTPKIRFKGFTDDWEQRKLGDVCSRVQGNDGRMELPTLTISAGNGWMRQEDRFSGNIAGKEQKNYTLLRKGELSYNHGNSKLAKYGTVFSLQTYEEALVPRVYHSFKVKEGNCDFVEYYFATKLPDRELSKLISSGARMDGLLNIGYDEFMGIQMKFPSTLEQRKISLYFRKLDHLITLHQRKCDETKELKKFMLQKMFPKNGEKNPEIRFEGFTDDWEQRKLRENLSFLKDGTHGTHKDVEDGPLLLSAKNIKNGTVQWDESDRRISEDEFKSIHANFKLKEGDVLLTIVGSIGETAILNNSEGITFQRSVAFLRPASKIISEFLYSEIQGYKFQKELNERKSTSAQPGIYLSDLGEIPISYPINMDEQVAIGHYFTNIDHLITLHQRKCEKLKELKKFMLQNMFV